jgi:predicted membrane-bound dolichyl-phosphate-mannose-protein mannosyltransferase
MIRLRVFIFLILSIVFALTHYFAMQYSLYWHFSWFDIVMHFWGGGLLALGVHALSTFSRLHFKPTLPILLVVLSVAIFSWEIFERSVGLFDPETYVYDTVKDIILGFAGGLLAHLMLRRYTIE